MGDLGAERIRQLEAENAELRARDERQSAIAGLSQTAIGAFALGAVVDEAAAVAAATLGTELSAVIEFLDGDEAVLRAGIGWGDGVVGQYRLDAAACSSATFIPPPFVALGVSCAVNVNIRGPSRPWGILGVYAAGPRSFSADDTRFLQSAANVLALAVERQHQEAARNRENEILEAIFDNIPVMISFYDPSGRLLRANREWERVLGWTVEEARQIDLFTETYPDPQDRQRVLEFLRKSEQKWEDFMPRARDGRIIDSSWIRFPLSDGSRIGFGIDMTDRRRAEKVLAETQSRFSRVFQASPVALGMSTIAEGRVIDVNQSWLELFGYRREEVIGRTNGELNINVNPQDRPAVVQRIYNEGTIRNLEMRLRRKSGEIRDIIVSAVPIDLDGEGDVWISSHIDITERKQAEAERDRLLSSETLARAEAESNLEMLHAIRSITDSALHHLALDDLLQEMLGRLRLALGSDFATVLLLEEDGKHLLSRVAAGHEAGDSIRVPLGKGVSGRIAATGQPLIVDELHAFDLSGIEGISSEEIYKTTQSVMGAPLQVGPNVIGVLTVSSSRSRRFSEKDLSLLLLVAQRVAPAIEMGRLIETVRAGRERQKALSRRLLKAQEEERRRLSVELHDELGQILTAARMKLESIDHLASVPQASAKLWDAIACVDQAMHSVRDLALNLRPSVLDDLGLPAALRWYADRLARDGNLVPHLSIDTVPHIEPGLETACFRVAQEALTNVARHAHAHNVWLDLHLTTEAIEVCVRDDGIGFDAAVARDHALSGASMGLLGMEERVTLMDGELEVHSSTGNGTEVRARFPVSENVVSQS